MGQDQSVGRKTQALAIVVGLAVAGVGLWLLSERTPDIPWYVSGGLCLVGLAIALPNRMLAIWSSVKDKIPGAGSGD